MRLFCCFIPLQKITELITSKNLFVDEGEEGVDKEIERTLYKPGAFS